MCSSDIFLGFLALLFPPLPVWVKCGICSADSVINILLCLLGFIPGLLHSWYIIAKYPEPSYDYQRVPENPEGGRVTYIVVPPQAHPVPAPKPYNHHAQTQGQQQQQHGYGTVPGAQQQHYQAQAQAGSSSSNAAAPHNNNNAGDDDAAPPPPYNEAVGDHKVQTRN